MILEVAIPSAATTPNRFTAQRRFCGFVQSPLCSCIQRQYLLSPLSYLLGLYFHRGSIACYMSQPAAS